MPQRQLSVVTYSIIVSRNLYCMLSQHREVSSVLNFKRVKRFGYIDTELTVIDELLSQSEYDLFVKTRIPGHTLYIICFPV